jgi:trans-2,3-dihydro-3-hydroxyanthranilate isomerase
MVEPLGVDLSYVYTRGGDNPTSSFRSRAFAPTGGVLEDPATGSATALLAAQLVKAESLKNGTHKWQLEQGYEMGRPSDLFLEADVNQGNLVSVRVAGQAVKVMQGTLEI